MNKDLLMTYEEYSKTKWEFPYCYKLEKNGQYLYYFGAMHSFDPKHYQYPVLKDFFNDFLEKIKGISVVFIEGGVPKTLRGSEEESIISGCEAQFIDFLAKNSGLNVISPELPKSILLEQLLKDFSLDEVAYYFFARTCLQWNKIAREVRDFNKYVNRMLEKDMGDLSKNYLYPNSKLLKIHVEIFNVDLDINDKVFFQKITAPDKSTNVINKIAKLSSKLRDLEMLNEIEKYWLKNTNIFIVYGGTHAVMQEQVIKSLVE